MTTKNRIILNTICLTLFATAITASYICEHKLIFLIIALCTIPFIIGVNSMWSAYAKNVRNMLLKADKNKLFEEQIATLYEQVKKLEYKHDFLSLILNINEDNGLFKKYKIVETQILNNIDEAITLIKNNNDTQTTISDLNILITKNQNILMTLNKNIDDILDL